MPPTIFSSGNVNMNQPYVFGQSGTDRPEPVLVTSPPAKIRTAVESGDEQREEMEAHCSGVDGLIAVEREGSVLRFLGADA